MEGARDKVKLEFDHAEATLFQAIKKVRSKDSPADKVERLIKQVSKVTSNAVKAVNDLMAQDKTTINAILNGLDPELRKLITGKNKPAIEAKSAVTALSDVADGVFGAVGKAVKEVGSATKPSYWIDKLIIGDFEALDLDEAVSKQEKTLMGAINNIRKKRATVFKIQSQVIKLTRMRLKMLDKSVAAAKKRFEAAGKRAQALPDLKVIMAA